MPKYNIKEFRADPNRIKASEVQPRRRSYDVLAELMVARKAYNHAKLAVKGRFGSQSELLSFLAVEIAKRERPRWSIADDAGIPYTTLKSLVSSGKVLVAPNP